MADTIKLLWGDRELDLTAPPYALSGSLVVTLAEPTVVRLDPDFGPPIVARLKPNDRIISFTLKVPLAGSTAAAINAVTDLKLLVDGDNQIAAQSDQDPVYLALEKDGGNGVMLHPIRYGNVDDGSAYFHEFAQGTYPANGVRIKLIVSEAGQAQTAISLKNYFPNGDFTIFDSGTAVGWNIVGSATHAAETTRYLTNGYSQQVTPTAAASADGIRSDAITCNDDDLLAAHIAISADSDADNITLSLTDGSLNVVQSKTFNPSSPANYDYSYRDNAGNMWYRYSFSDDGSPARAAADARLNLQRGAAGGSSATPFYVDNAYITVGTTTVPAAWSSYFITYNRGDRAVANPERQAHVDVWGVPGDMPAYLQDNIDPQSSSTGAAKQIVFSKHVDAKYLVHHMPYWVESDQLAYTESGGGAWSDQTGTTDNHFKRFTSSSTADSATAAASTAFFDSVNTPQKFWSVPRRLYALVRTSDAGTIFTANGQSLTVNAINTWELLDFGPINREGYLTPSSAATTANAAISLTATNVANTKTVDVDAFGVLYAVDDGYMALVTSSDTSTNDYILDGAAQQFYVNDARGYYEVPIGNCWTIQPGNVVNRLVHLDIESDDEFIYARQFTHDLTITPRARLLLGSQTNL